MKCHLNNKLCKLYLTLWKLYDTILTIKEVSQIARNLKIKIARAEKDMTQKALAEAVGISRQTMNAIEQGEYNPTIRLCRAICRVLGKSLDELFGEEDTLDEERTQSSSWWNALRASPLLCPSPYDRPRGISWDRGEPDHWSSRLKLRLFRLKGWMHSHKSLRDASDSSSTDCRKARTCPR